MTACVSGFAVLELWYHMLRYATNVPSKVSNRQVPPEHLRSEISLSRTCNIPNWEVKDREHFCGAEAERFWAYRTVLSEAIWIKCVLRSYFVKILHLTINYILKTAQTNCHSDGANFLSILREFHADMSARVVQGGELSKSFGVNTGVKQGCVLAPIIFNLFLVAVTLTQLLPFVLCTRGLQTFLSEGDIGYYSTERGPDILNNVIV